MTTLQIINDRVFPQTAKTYEEWNTPESRDSVQSPLFLPTLPPKEDGMFLTWTRFDWLSSWRLHNITVLTFNHRLHRDYPRVRPGAELVSSDHVDRQSSQPQDDPRCLEQPAETLPCAKRVADHRPRMEGYTDQSQQTE